MATYPASRALQTAELTLVDVAIAVQLASWPARRRQETELALRTIGRALDKPLERIPADPRHLSARLKEVAPRAIGVSPRRWNNVRSLTRGALNLVRQMAPGRNTNPLTPSWDALWSPLESKRVKTSLSRFVRFCSAAGIEPDAVTAAIFPQFRAHLDDFFDKEPGRAVRRNAARLAGRTECRPQLAQSRFHNS